MICYRGITWDHPRGKNALVAAAQDTRWRDAGLHLSWSAHSLEHFESHPIADLARNYDLIVLDHPHVGEALQDRALLPLDAVIDEERLRRWARQSVGPSFGSYSAEGSQWALPLDAATQVAVRKPALVPEPPGTWDDVVRLSATAPVALSLAGPHAFLTFASMCAAYGGPVGGPHAEEAIDRPADFAPEETAKRVLEQMRMIASRAPLGTASQNPISLLQRMTESDDVAYCPLVFGYVNYSSPTLQFSDAPSAVTGGVPQSTIGGTGLAISAHAEVTDILIEHLDWLMSPVAQRSFIPHHEGQPSSRDAWLDNQVNEASAGFYQSTLTTIENSWVRPRFAGYISFQSSASAIIRSILDGSDSVANGLARLRSEFTNASPSTTERV